MENELDRVCTTLDKLTLDTLTLMEEIITLKISLENCMSEGELHLAKSRYIMGHNKVSSLQLPTENSLDIDPLVVINRDSETNSSQNVFSLEHRNEKIKGDSTVLNPIKWFGVLVPQNLHQAQAKFKQALFWVARCASLQVQLHENCNDIVQLKAHKKKIMKVEE